MDVYQTLVHFAQMYDEYGEMDENKLEESGKFGVSLIKNISSTRTCAEGRQIILFIVLIMLKYINVNLIQN